MSIRYERDDRRRRVHIMSVGPTTTEQVLGTLDRQAADGAWSYSVLYDARASASKPTGNDLRALLLRVGELTTRYGPRGPVAFVTSSARLSRAGQAYANAGELTALNMKVFTSLADAERWLDGCAGVAPAGE
jgi:hypothetical protein